MTTPTITDIRAGDVNHNRPGLNEGSRMLGASRGSDEARTMLTRCTTLRASADAGMATSVSTGVIDGAIADDIAGGATGSMLKCDFGQMHMPQ
jgi:hypothetical protein